MGTIMGNNDPDEWTTSHVEGYWSFSANAQDVSDPEIATTGATDDVQPVENAFSALNTDLGNLSSTQQSTAQYYSSCQQQMEGMDETIMQGYATEEQTMISNQVVS